MNVESTLLKSGSFDEFSGALPFNANYMQIIPNSKTTGGTPTVKTSITANTADLSNVNGSYSWWYGCNHSNVDKAYQVVRALMRAKVIRIQTLDKFFTVMDEVIKVV